MRDGVYTGTHARPSRKRPPRSREFLQSLGFVALYKKEAAHSPGGVGVRAAHAQSISRHVPRCRLPAHHLLGNGALGLRRRILQPREKRRRLAQLKSTPGLDGGQRVLLAATDRQGRAQAFLVAAHDAGWTSKRLQWPPPARPLASNSIYIPLPIRRKRRVLWPGFHLRAGLFGSTTPK